MIGQSKFFYFTSLLLKTSPVRMQRCVSKLERTVCSLIEIRVNFEPGGYMRKMIF